MILNKMQDKIQVES
jgi:hypothetical protein